MKKVKLDIRQMRSLFQNKNFFMLLGVLLLMYVLFNLGVTGAYFNDQEASSNNVVRTINNWYDLAWHWRKPITINNGGVSTQTNYQVKLTLDTQTLVNQGKMNSAGNDIRFTDSTNYSTALSYWIESGINTGSTIIWVKIPSIPTGSSTIYLYYGNSSATASSNGPNTFIFFDDFESGNLNKWTIVTGSTWTIATDQKRSGSYSVRGGPLSQVSERIVATGLNLTDIAFDAWWREGSIDTDAAQLVRANTSTNFYDYEINKESSYDWALSKFINNSWSSFQTTTNYQPPAGTWFKVTTSIRGRYMKFLYNDSQILPASGWCSVGTEIASGTVGFNIWTTPDYNWFDDVRVRKMTATEPVLSSVGAEE
jgi:hypothetical protein